MPAPVITRRSWLRHVAVGSLGLASAPLIATAARLATPPQAMGPFYPLQLPLDQDNDLTRVQGQDGQPHGEIIDVVGQLLDGNERPIAGMQLEIWQVNGHGRYHHPDDDQDKPLDPNFQGFGRTVTSADGSYRFRTVRPVAYPGRAPHIHFGVTGPKMQRFFTQMYLEGARENSSDFLLRRLSPAEQRTLIAALQSAGGNTRTKVGRFDIVLGSSVLSDRP